MSDTRSVFEHQTGHIHERMKDEIFSSAYKEIVTMYNVNAELSHVFLEIYLSFYFCESAARTCLPSEKVVINVGELCLKRVIVDIKVMNSASH